MPPTPEDRQLAAAAAAARSRAYAPYSKFAVGAALLAGDGTTITGANVENASFGLSICAERAAVYAAVAAGVRDFRAVAVAGEGGTSLSPCGACRQVLAEFNPEMRVVFGPADDLQAVSLDELLPRAFSRASLQS